MWAYLWNCLCLQGPQGFTGPPGEPGEAGAPVSLESMLQSSSFHYRFTLKDLPNIVYFSSRVPWVHVDLLALLERMEKM